MLEFWKDDLTNDEEEALIEKAAAEIEKRKLEVPAVVLLESHKPLAFIGSQSAIAFAPFLAPFLGFEFVNNYSRLFAKRENVEKLLVRIEKGPRRPVPVEES
ncbi:MAG TPA: hypothetical protein VJ835_07935 [Fimbriimonadaceae bacterium]|nr:hypothetical protein [Fimbriimonadaceae bacterium]